MLRKLVLNLPKINTASKHAICTIRRRNLRSLSPVTNKLEAIDGVSESASCTKIDQASSPPSFNQQQSRTLCYSKEYYAHNNSEKIKEIKWREDPGIQPEKEVKEEAEETMSTAETNQYEILEQYELEAARPRPEKSQELLQTFRQRYQSPFSHLQPDQLKPYGSQDNLYSPSLIRPTNSIKYPKRQLRRAIQEKKELETVSSASTIKRLSTSPTYITKEESKFINQTSENKRLPSAPSQKERLMKEIERFSSQRQFPLHDIKQQTDICPPPLFTYFNKDLDDAPIQFSTPQMRRERKLKENSNSNLYYKASYSDLVKLRLKKVSKKANIVVNSNSHSNLETKNSKSSTNLPLTEKKSQQKLLELYRSVSGQRSITTRPKIETPLQKMPPYCIETTPKPSSSKLVEFKSNQRNYSKSKNKKRSKSKKKDRVRDFNPECEDICTEKVNRAKRAKGRNIPFEPRICEDEKKSSSVFLPSKVKLAVPFCTPRPIFKDCIPPKKCPPRADECLKMEPKVLPKLHAGECPCIDPEVPTYTPKLEKLNMKFEDPPKVVCHPPPCQIPRADDVNPPRYKPLKAYVPGDCECIEPPPMTEVKLKRLPRCQPDEVCRPVRVCPIKETCPPRADECLVVEPKILPPLKGAPCPCIDPPAPKVAPAITRLNLHVPEPPRVCKRDVPCGQKKRADDHLKLHKKKLPKFVPGDCPCEDKPMLDWKVKRLECIDEPQDCVVPDPCNVFPRADWGCWKYDQYECAEVDEKCIEKDMSCLPPEPKKKDPCDKNPCKNKGLIEIRYMPKRKYSNTGSSMKLYQTVKAQKNNDHIKTTANYKPPFIPKKSASTKTVKSNSPETKVRDTPSKKSEKRQSLRADIIRLLNSLDKGATNEDYLLFTPKTSDQIDYESIQKKIASETMLLDSKRKMSTLKTDTKKSKSVLTIASRAISTTKIVSKNEKDIKKEKHRNAKRKCKNIKPTIKALMCKKACPTLQLCPKPGREHRPSCKVERVPVCCEKEETPYASYSDTIQESIRPYTNTPQFTCNRTQYGFYPNFKKEFDPFDQKKDKKKHFSTSSLTDCTPMHTTKTPEKPAGGLLGTNKPLLDSSSKASVMSNVRSTKTLAPYHQRPLSTKIFQIKRPVACPKPASKICEKKTEQKKPLKVECVQPDGKEPTPRRCCYREPIHANVKRKVAPFPAFSDCLDEEMEDILTECPLDKEKYLRMQPRFMNPPSKPFSLKPPPPVQGKLDLLKEQACIREKLCVKNEGLTQYCTDFGKPIPLMKSKKIFVERNPDCEKIEKLKRIGRWPPFTLRQNRKMCSLASTHSYCNVRHMSTMGLNTMREVERNTNNEGRRVYIRSYYALVNTTEKALCLENEKRLKEYVQKTFPEINERTKIVHLRNNEWNLEDLKKHDETYMTRRAKRFYTTYKTKQRNALRKLFKNLQHPRHFSQNGCLRKATQLEADFKFLHKARSNSYEASSNNCDGRNKRKTNESERNTRKRRKNKLLNNNVSKCVQKAEKLQMENMKFLQPQYTVMPETPSSIQEYPCQENIDLTVGLEYYKCRHGLRNEGITLDCSSFNEYLNNPNYGNFKFSTDDQVRQHLGEVKTKESSSNNSEKLGTMVEQNKTQNIKPETCDPQSTVEFLVQEHRVQSPQEATVCCKVLEKRSRTKTKQNPKSKICDEDKKKIENLCLENCMKNIPCNLPEEDKVRMCKKECRKIFEDKEDNGNVDTCSEPKVKQKVIYKCNKPKPPKVCVVPKPDCPDLNEEELQITPKKCEKFEFKCDPKPTAVICRPKLSKSNSFSQIETFFQKVVNYFKARPNCPAPGDWKKKALRDKAERAATAAGLVVVDPKCLPDSILRTVKTTPKKICKTCPDPCDKKDIQIESKKSSCPPASTKLARRTFSTVFLPVRTFSSSVSYKNLEEINKMLEEEEAKKKQLKIKETNLNFRRELGVAVEQKDSKLLEALEMSVDLELNKPVQLSNLYRSSKCYPKTYFGYSDIIPSRENILEKAWRVSIETYTRNNAPKTFEFFNEFFTRVENSIQSIEDLEKLKTENVLRELEEFLEKNSKKNKK
ncbi:uncharacterized protein LOC143197859 isoform X2 [Rhynchophorus ferrugineus]|uniref:uncharacterized protein LOC143197859 isoform X2 n=1 Tax=Rhynchophorus ferrugineus TaxID=354439 RepID=UPI003FCCAD4C